MLEIREGDALTLMREIPARAFDAIFCDPPYGISFMGKEWDHGVPSADVWAEAKRVLKPGSPVLAFGGTRTWHRLACAMEDGGLEIQDTLMWLYGSGFPKHASKLKPAWEPVIYARVPGAALPLNIDGCRISTSDETGRANSGRKGNGGVFGESSTYDSETHPLGRWPANVLLDEEAAALLDEQTGVLTSGKPGTRRKPHETNAMSGTLGLLDRPEVGYADSGGASRFFYCAKASRKERAGSTHPTMKPLALAEYLARLILPPGNGRLLVPFSGSGSEMLGALRAGWQDVTGIELSSEYAAIARARLEAAQTPLLAAD